MKIKYNNQDLTSETIKIRASEEYPMRNQPLAHRNHEDKFNKPQRRAFRNPWFWVSVAALVILPFIFFTWLSHDNFVNTMQHQGCHVVNTFDNGTKVWQCPKAVR